MILQFNPDENIHSNSKESNLINIQLIEFLCLCARFILFTSNNLMNSLIDSSLGLLKLNNN